MSRLNDILHLASICLIAFVLFGLLAAWQLLSPVPAPIWSPWSPSDGAPVYPGFPLWAF